MSAYCFFDVREITDRAKVDEYLRRRLCDGRQLSG